MLLTPSTEDLLKLKGEVVPLQDLLALFGTRIRNDQINLTIRQALQEAGLSTLPYFGTCGSRVDLHVVALESTEEAAAQEDEEEEEEDFSAGSLPEQSFRIGDLPAARGGVVSVLPTDTLTATTYMMRDKNYSQIPVLEGQSTLIGVVTWQSVAMMYDRNDEPKLANAVETDPPVVQTHHDFFSLLPMISEHGYVLVRDNSGRFSGIVTASDITDRFAATAWPFFVIGEIEFRLRKCLGAKISEDSILAVQKWKKTGLIQDLTFGNYVFLLDGAQTSNRKLRERADRNWTDLGWSGVDRTQFVSQLKRVKDIRNKIAHFDPEPLSPRLCDELRRFVGHLRMLT